MIRRVLWFAGVPLVALVGGYAGFFPVFTMGLITPLYIVGPLAILTGALLATLLSGWLANFASWGESRSRLLAVFGISSLGMVAGLFGGRLSGRVLFSFSSFQSLWPSLVGWAFTGLIFVAATSAAVWLLRRPSPSTPIMGEGGLGLAGVLALAVSLAWALVLSLDEGMAYQLDLVEAGFGPVVPLSGIVWISSAMVAVGTILLVWQRLRQPRVQPGTEDIPSGEAGTDSPWGGAMAQDAALTLLLTGLAPVLVVGVIGLGCTLTYCGA